MSEESIDKKKVRLFRWVVFIVLLIVACGFVWAIREDSDIIAGVTCLVGGIALGVGGRGEKNPFDAGFEGIGMGVLFFFLWMAVKFIIIYR